MSAEPDRSHVWARVVTSGLAGRGWDCQATDWWPAGASMQGAALAQVDPDRYVRGLLMAIGGHATLVARFMAFDVDDRAHLLGLLTTAACLGATAEELRTWLIARLAALEAEGEP
jgi:hypothetical protein